LPVNQPYYAEGVYVGEVIGQGLGLTKNGNRQFVLQCKILGTPIDDSYIPASQQYTRTVYRVITDKTMEYVARDLEALDFDGSNGFGPLDPEHPRHQSFKGHQVNLYCKHEDDLQGFPRERWSIANGAASLTLTPVEKKDIRELDQLYGKMLPKKRAASESNVAVADSLEITDDDLPF
jgi:hypothetical protein